MASPRLILHPGRALFTLRPPRTASLPTTITSLLRVTPRLTLTLPLHRPYSSNPSRAEEAIRRLAKEAAWSRKDDKRPVTKLIYHAGTPRILFLAFGKLTSLLAGAFFLLLVGPAYVKAGHPPPDTLATVGLGLVPAFFIAFTTAPFVTHVYLRVPGSVVASGKTALQRFVDGGLENGTQITLTTMSLFAKPRHTTMPLSELVPCRRRLGLVNYARAQSAASRAKEAKARKWYHWRPVREFFVMELRAPTRVRYQEKKTDQVERWIWTAVEGKLKGR